MTVLFENYTIFVMRVLSLLNKIETLYVLSYELIYRVSLKIYHLTFFTFANGKYLSSIF